MTEPSEPTPPPSNASFALPPEASVVSEHGTFAAPPPVPARRMPITLMVILFFMLLSVVAAYAGGSFWAATIELLVTMGLASGSNWARWLTTAVLVLQMLLFFGLLIFGRNLEPLMWWTGAFLIVIDAVVIYVLQRAEIETYFAPAGAAKPRA